MDYRLFQSLFHKKLQKGLLFFTAFFLFSISTLPATSRYIASLSLDFTRNENWTESMKGSIIYNQTPFFFVFKTRTPQPQTVFINDEGAFYLEGDTITLLPEGGEYIQQICNDFLTWFSEDFGLSEASFTPRQPVFEDKLVVTQWDYTKKDLHPIDTVLVSSDINGKICSLKMYQDFSTLLTQTDINEYKYFAGRAFPVKILSTAYQNNEPVLQTLLCFSNISFNQPEVNEKNSSRYLQKISLEEAPPKDISSEDNYSRPSVNAARTYDVSIPSVLLKSSFRFYKKFITNQDMTNCPFYPSCSQYMVDAVNQNGVFGLIQGLERLKRCTTTEHKRDLYPTLSNGKHYDPVPAKKSKGEAK
jgi:putative component of membrane protein insertase Oxa1/YidC/SpoIIIJ protein YidD